jgi:hypothetical protein
MCLRATDERARFCVAANDTILDLSLPGTHDSMTWDLSTTVCTTDAP